MPHNFLQSIKLISQNELEGEVYLDPSHEVFRDHFPSRAMLPAAMMVDLTVKLVERQVWALGKMTLHPIPDQYPKFKFYSELRPGENIQVRCETDYEELSEGSSVKVSATAMARGDKVYEGEFLATLYPLADFAEQDSVKGELERINFKDG